EAPLLCFTWDGVGLGPDGTLWGGEALLGWPGAWERVASWRPFRLPGGERVAREPWRTALALSWESGLPWAAGAALCEQATAGAPGAPIDLLHAAWQRGLNAPETTSVGRLFDAAAAMLGVCLKASYEGEAPMRLETLCGDAESDAAAVAVPLERDPGGIWRSDWSALLPALLDGGVEPAARANAFHLSLAHALCEQAVAVRRQSGVARVGLS